MTPARWWFQTDLGNTVSRRVATQDAAIVALATSAAAAGESLDDGFREVATVAARLLGVARVGIWRLDQSRTRLICDHLHGPDATIPGPLDLTANEYPRYFAALAGERVLDASDAVADPRTSELTDGYLRPLGISSVLDAAIRASGSVLGVVCHEHVGPPRTWQEDEKRFAGAIGDLLAVVIQSAERRSAERAKEDEARLSAALAHLGQELIAGFNDPGTRLTDRLCRATAEVIACSAVHVVRRVPERAGYEWVASAGTSPDERAVSEAIFVPDELVDLTKLDRDGVSVDRFEASGSTPLDALTARFTERVLVLTAPIRREEDLIGLLCIQRRGDVADVEFSETDRRIGYSIGRLASMALETERLIEELRAARRVKSDFLAMMSHELRTPLNAISGYTELLLNGALGELNEQQTEALETIRSRSDEQCRMVENVLSVEKFELGEVRLCVARCDPRDLIDEVLRDVPRKADVDLEVDVPEGSPSFWTDAGKLKAALREVVSNAFKFTLEGRVCVSAHARRGGFAFEVADTGVGIPSESRREIFAAFRQADSSSTRRFEGIGMGLYLAQRLIEQIDGNIEVESEPGRGTAFRVWVPSREAPSAASSTEGRSPDFRRGPRVSAHAPHPTTRRSRVS